MAALRGRCFTGAVALTPATAKTLIQIVAPANQRIKILSFSVSTDGITAAAIPMTVRILRQTSAGTFSNTTNAPNPDEAEMTETFQTNYQTVATVEPSAGAVLRDFLVPTFNGGYQEQCAFDRELIVKGGTRLGWECTAAAIVNAFIEVQIEE